ncbi:MAG: NAD(P)/FAD-dependent oxidoreductase [Dehalobacterium sp.]|jgi:NAD(P)H-nitrite reductase large subunit
MPKSDIIAIIGNGGAAIYAIKDLRENNSNAEIHLFSDNTSPAYNPMLTSYFVAGQIPIENCHPFGSDFNFYHRNDVQLHLGSQVVKLDALEQTLETAQGEKFCYDQCLIATGASPVLPQIPGINSRRVFTLRSMEDAQSLKQALNNHPKKAIVIGASMVGIKLVELFLKANVKVCLADRANHVFPLAANEYCAHLIEDSLKERHVKLRLGACITEIEEISKGINAYFSDQEGPEEADLAVICIGTKTNTQFLDPDQVEIDRGILVNQRMQTNQPNLYAAGDVAQGLNLLNGKKEIIGLWANACYQGRTAGRNMAGKTDFYAGGMPGNISHFLEMDFVSIGDALSSSDVSHSYHPQENTYCGLTWDQGKLVGVNLLNCFTAAGMLKQKMQKELNQWHTLANPKNKDGDLWKKLLEIQVPQLRK